MRTEHSVKFVDMGACLDAPARAADRYDIGSIVDNVILIVNLSDDLLQDVFDGDQTRDRAELVNH